MALDLNPECSLWEFLYECNKDHLAYTALNYFGNRITYWDLKIRRNIERDKITKQQLESMGGRVLTVWECELKKTKLDETMKTIINTVKQGKPFDIDN